MRQLPCTPETDSTSHHVPMGHFFARSSRRQEMIGAGEGLSVGLGVGSEVGFDVGFGDGEEV